MLGGGGGYDMIGVYLGMYDIGGDMQDFNLTAWCVCMAIPALARQIQVSGCSSTCPLHCWHVNMTQSLNGPVQLFSNQLANLSSTSSLPTCEHTLDNQVRNQVRPTCFGYLLGQKTIYKLFKFFKFYVEKKFCYNTNFSLCSIPWLSSHSLLADHDFSTASPLSWEKKFVGKLIHSTVASCTQMKRK